MGGTNRESAGGTGRIEENVALPISRSAVGHSPNRPQSEQSFVSCDQSQIQDSSRGGQNPIGRVLVQRQLPRHERDLVRQWSLSRGGRRPRQPGGQIFVDSNSSLVIEGQHFPRAHRRKPEFVRGVSKITRDASAKPPLIPEIPEPDGRVHEPSQSRKTSHSSSSFAGDPMSPRISNVPFIDPIQKLRDLPPPSAERLRRRACQTA